MGVPGVGWWDSAIAITSSGARIVSQTQMRTSYSAADSGSMQTAGVLLIWIQTGVYIELLLWPSGGQTQDARMWKRMSTWPLTSETLQQQGL